MAAFWKNFHLLEHPRTSTDPWTTSKLRASGQFSNPRTSGHVMCQTVRHMYNCTHFGDVRICVEPCEHGFDIERAECRADPPVHEVVGYIDRDELCRRCRERRRQDGRQEDHHRERATADPGHQAQDPLGDDWLPGRYREELTQRRTLARRRHDPRRRYRNTLARHERETDSPDKRHCPIQ